MERDKKKTSLRQCSCCNGNNAASISGMTYREKRKHLICHMTSLDECVLSTFQNYRSSLALTPSGKPAAFRLALLYVLLFLFPFPCSSC